MLLINIVPSRHRVGQGRVRVTLLALTLALSLTGCATLPGGKADPRDRFERFNRTVYAFNTKVDHAVLRPVARGYVKAIPAPIRLHISDLLSNLAYPTVMVNDFLQGKADDGAADLARIVVNTTLGIGGLFDPASRMGIERHDEDFGQTLGRWGMPSGPYLMLPFLGPSDMRDAFGLGVNYYALYELYSNNLFKDNWVSYSVSAVQVINTRAALLDTDQIIQSAYDPYAFVRNAYLQRRQYLIHDGDVPADQDLPDDGAQGSSTPITPQVTPEGAPQK